MARVTVKRPRRRSLNKSYLAAVPRRPGLRDSLSKFVSPLCVRVSRNIGDFSQTESPISVTSSSSSSEDLSSEEEHWWVKNYHSRLISKDSSVPTRVLRKRKPSNSRVLVLRIRQYSGPKSWGSSGLRSGIPVVSSISSVHASSTPAGVAFRTWQANSTTAGPSGAYWFRSRSQDIPKNATSSRNSNTSSILTPASPATNARKQDSSSESLKQPGPRSRAISNNKPLVFVKAPDNRQTSKLPAPVLPRSRKTNAESSGSAAFRSSVPASSDNSSPPASVRVLSSRDNLSPHGASSAISSDRNEIDVTQSSGSPELNTLENIPPVLARVKPETAGNPAGLNKRDADGLARPRMPILRPQVRSENIPPSAATPATNRILRSSSIMRSVLNSGQSSPPAKKAPKHRSKYNRGEKNMAVIIRLEKQREADGWYAWMDTWEADLDRAIAAETAIAAASNLKSSPTVCKMPLPGPAVEHARATTGQNDTQTEIPLPADEAEEEVQFLCSFVPQFRCRYTRSALQAKSSPVIFDLTDSN